MGIAKLKSKFTAKNASTKGSNDESNEASQEGPGLIEHLVGLTGLPREVLQRELKKILEEAGHRWETLTVDQLRKAMMVYLNRVYSQFKDNAPRISRH